VEDEDIPMSYGAAHAMLRAQQSAASANLYSGAGGDLQKVAAVGRGVVELNPIVGGFNGGYGAIAGKDAITGKQLTTGQRLKSGGEGLLAAAPLVFKLGKVANVAVKAEEVAAAGKALETIKASKNGMFLGVVEKGEVRLFQAAAGGVEGHADLVKAGLVSKGAEGFSVGVKNGKISFLRTASTLNSAGNNYNLSSQTLQQVQKALSVPAEKLIKNP
jgi:hypothetical protein